MFSNIGLFFLCVWKTNIWYEYTICYIGYPVFLVAFAAPMDLCFLCGYTICFWRLLNGYSYQQRENISSWKTKTIWGSYSLRKSQTLNCNLNWLYDHFATYWELNSPNATFITPIKTSRAICQEYCLKHKMNKVIGWISHNFCSISFWCMGNSSLSRSP